MSLKWSKNMIKNPIAEVDLADWDVESGTLTRVDEGYIGTHCFQLVNGSVKQTFQGFRALPPYLLVELAYIPYVEANIETVLNTNTQDLKIDVEYGSDHFEYHVSPLRNEHSEETL